MTCECGDIVTRDGMCDECFAEELDILRRLEEEGPDGGHVEGFPRDTDDEDFIELVAFDEFQFDTDGNAYACEGDDE